MNVSNCVIRQLIACVVIAMLAACAGSRASNDFVNAIPQVPNDAKRSALLYVSDRDAGTVYMYGYPSLKPAGTLSGLNSPTGMCVDKNTGNVWITETGPYVTEAVEFAHGGAKPIRTVQIQADNFFNACAINPISNELAVANITFGGDDPGDVVRFNLATGEPQAYYGKGIYYIQFVGYDESGNLFVDGTPKGFHSSFRLNKLSSGARSLVKIRWRGPHIVYSGNIQYDGSHMTVGDVGKALIYQTLGGKVIGTTVLNGACSVNQYYIDGDKVIAPSNCKTGSTVSIYDYPAGGAPLTTLTGFRSAFGAVISR
jgi:hypothetical protein